MAKKASKKATTKKTSKKTTSKKVSKTKSQTKPKNEAVIEKSDFASEGRLIYAFLQKTAKTLNEVAELLKETLIIIQRQHVDIVDLRPKETNPNTKLEVEETNPNTKLEVEETKDETQSIDPNDDINIFDMDSNSPKEPELTQEDVKNLLLKVKDLHGLEKIRDIITKVGASRVSEIDPDKYQEINKLCKDLL